MSKEITVSSELIERLTERLEALEIKIDAQEEKKKKKKKKKKNRTKKFADSVSEVTEDSIKGCGKFAGGLIDATAEAMKEGADALTSLSDDIDKKKLGTIPAAVVSVMRKTIEIQNKALDKFEESYDEYDDD